MGTMHDPRAILITGASSGIGAALARVWAGPGRTLFLIGRNGPRLDAVAAACTALGAVCATSCVDVLDREAMARCIAGHDAERPLDLVIANAGISAGTRKLGNAPWADDREVFAVNVDGVANTVEPALERMRARPVPDGNGLRGQIAIMSSLAGFRAFREAPAYCASKAAVRYYGEGLRRAYAREAIGVSVVCPGFVRSPMTTSNDFPMPFLMDADRAAGIIRRGLARGRARIAFPWPMYAAVRLAAMLP